MPPRLALDRQHSMTPYQGGTVSEKAQRRTTSTAMGAEKENRTTAPPLIPKRQMHPNSLANLAPPFEKATPTPVVPGRKQRDADKPDLNPTTGQERK